MSRSHPLTTYRKRHKPPLTQDQLAEKIGVTKSAVSRWEAGKRTPSKDERQRISETTGIAIGKLVEASDRLALEAAE